MAKPFLSLQQFVNFEKIQNRSFFQSDNAFDYLGSSLASWLQELLKQLGVEHGPLIRGRVASLSVLEGNVFVDEGASIEPHVYIQGPAYIGPNAEVRQGAYIRGQVYVGAGAVVGHTTEVKGSILFDHAKAAHFAYVGDSILGHDVNLGAGTKLANLKLKGDEVKVSDPQSGKRYGSGLRKFGSILGDAAQTGCNAVLSPGTLLLPGALVHPCAHFHGTLLAGKEHRA